MTVAEDGNGGSRRGTVTVAVPFDDHTECVDDGRLYDSTTGAAVPP